MRGHHVVGRKACMSGSSDARARLDAIHDFRLWYFLTQDLAARKQRGEWQPPTLADLTYSDDGLDAHGPRSLDANAHRPFASLHLGRSSDTLSLDCISAVQ